MFIPACRATCLSPTRCFYCTNDRNTCPIMNLNDQTHASKSSCEFECCFVELLNCMVILLNRMTQQYFCLVIKRNRMAIFSSIQFRAKQNGAVVKLAAHLPKLTEKSYSIGATYRVYTYFCQWTHNGQQRSFNYENLVPKFRSPCPSDVLCPLHVQSAGCRGGCGYACPRYK